MQPFSITKVILFIQNPKKCIEQESKQIWMEKSFHFIYFVCVTNDHGNFSIYFHKLQIDICNSIAFYTISKLFVSRPVDRY